MMPDVNENSASEYLGVSFDGIIENRFTDISTLYVGEENIVLKAKRYGKWWILKGLSASPHETELQRQSLRKEFDIMAQLSHTSVVDVVALEHVEHRGVFIVMEYVEGTTLDRWLDNKPGRKQRRLVARQIVRAVEYIHSKNIVHRDIKPTNIMVTANGESVKLIDFGLADSDSHAVLKQPAGTMRYMAPEQAKIATPDVRNDIYSLGVLLDEMQLGYGGIVRKCKSSIERRYRNATELEKAIAGRNNRKRVVMLIAFTAALISVIVTAIIGMSQIGLLRRQNERSAGTADSLRHVIAQQKIELDIQATQLDSITQINREAEIKTRRHNEVVNNGMEIITRYVRNSPLKQHVDTLTNHKWFNYELTRSPLLEELYHEVDIYMKSLGDDEFSEVEKSGIRSTLTDYAQKAISPIFNKLQSLSNNDSTVKK